MNDELNLNLIVEEEKDQEFDLPKVESFHQNLRDSKKRKTADIFARKTAEQKKSEINE
jgi:hypothetical protein